MTATEAPVSPVEELLSRWRARDELYRRRIRSNRVVPLSAREVESIEANRRFEAKALPAEFRGEALRAVAGWIPPTGPV